MAAAFKLAIARFSDQVGGEFSVRQNLAHLRPVITSHDRASLANASFYNKAVKEDQTNPRSSSLRIDVPLRIWWIHNNVSTPAKHE